MVLIILSLIFLILLNSTLGRGLLKKGSTRCQASGEGDTEPSGGHFNMPVYLGVSLERLKEAVVLPTLDLLVPSNYRPVVNIHFWVTERVVAV